MTLVIDLVSDMRCFLWCHKHLRASISEGCAQAVCMIFSFMKLNQELVYSNNIDVGQRAQSLSCVLLVKFQRSQATVAAGPCLVIAVSICFSASQISW